MGGGSGKGRWEAMTPGRERENGEREGGWERRGRRVGNREG